MGRLTNKQKRKKLEAKVERKRLNKARLLAYLKNYGEPDLIQSASDSDFDPQIKQLVGAITTELSRASHGTIIDIGCGEGILLVRLLKIAAFKDVDEFLYFGTDHLPQIEKTLKIAFDAGIHRRVELINLTDFYKEWPSQDRLTKPYIVIVRNVLHELDIQQTSVLLHHIAGNLSGNDVLIIQDLQVSPVAERGNACWTSTDLDQTLVYCGFSTSVLNEPSRSGNQWFSIICRKTTNNAKNRDEIHHSILKNRERQYRSWLELGWLVPDDDSFREVVLAKLDFDLQCAALNFQLVREGSKGIARITKRQQSEIAEKTFVKQLINFAWKDVRGINEEILHLRPFRDRAHYLDKIEDFLLSDSSVLVIRGGPSSGKTILVRQALFRRTYNKEAVFVDIGSIPNVWSIIEKILSGVRCNFTPALLTSLTSIKFDDIRNEIEQFIHKISHRIIFSFDHFEKLLDDDGIIFDDEINKLMNLLINAPFSKIIFTTGREPAGAIFPSEKYFATDLPPVGRFPKGKHVENLLDDYVNKGELGIIEYPPKLFDAIDRHPYLTVLAGLIIRKRGRNSLEDESFLEEIRLDLRANLLSKLTDKSTAPLIEVLSLLRRPVPKAMLESLSDVNIVRAAEEAGLIYPSPDPGYSNLMAQLGVFRTTTPDMEDMYSDQALLDNQEADVTDITHLRIATEYEALYRSSSDPVWLREIHFHKLAAGNIKDAEEFGTAYSSEIFWAGNYWFVNKKDYSSALWAFETAHRLGIETAFTEMRRASCLIRLRKDGGEDIYNKLIAKYPSRRGLKLSYVSSFLYVKHFSEALSSTL